MNIVGQRFEASFVFSGGDRVHGGSEAAEFVEAELRAVCVDADGMVGNVPAHVHRDVLPAEGFEIFGHEFCAIADIGFGNGFAIGVPTVPTHRGTGSERNFVRGTRSGSVPIVCKADRGQGHGQKQEEPGKSGNETFCSHVCMSRRA